MPRGMDANLSNRIWLCFYLQVNNNTQHISKFQAIKVDKKFAFLFCCLSFADPNFGHFNSLS